MSANKVSYPAEAHRLTRELEDTSFWYQHRNSMIIHAIKKFIPGQPLIYDLGGGNGPVSIALMKEGYPCVLVEALPDAIAMAKKRNIENVVLSSIQEFKEMQLPIVLLADVVEHIEKDDELLRQLFNQIASGGAIVITVPAFNHITTDIDKEIGHFRRYDLKGMTKKLSEAGFIVQYKTYFFSLLYLPFLIFRVLPYKLGFKKKKTRDRRNSEHLSGNLWLNKFASNILRWENLFIRSNRKIPMGTSCLFIASKP